MASENTSFASSSYHAASQSSSSASRSSSNSLPYPPPATSFYSCFSVGPPSAAPSPLNKTKPSAKRPRKRLPKTQTSRLANYDCLKPLFGCETASLPPMGLPIPSFMTNTSPIPPSTFSPLPPSTFSPPPPSTISPTSPSTISSTLRSTIPLTSDDWVEQHALRRFFSPGTLLPPTTYERDRSLNVIYNLQPGEKIFPAEDRMPEWLSLVLGEKIIGLFTAKEARAMDVNGEGKNNTIDVVVFMPFVHVYGGKMLSLTWNLLARMELAASLHPAVLESRTDRECVLTPNGTLVSAISPAHLEELVRTESVFVTQRQDFVPPQPLLSFTDPPKCYTSSKTPYTKEWHDTIASWFLKLADYTFETMDAFIEHADFETLDALIEHADELYQGIWKEEAAQEPVKTKRKRQHEPEAGPSKKAKRTRSRKLDV